MMGAGSATIVWRVPDRAGALLTATAIKQLEKTTAKVRRWQSFPGVGQ